MLLEIRKRAMATAFVFFVGCKASRTLAAPDLKG